MKLAPLLSQTARPVWRREPLLTALTVAVGWLFLMVPRPSGWVGEHVHKEDGEVFLTDFLARGWASVFDVYSGYLHVGPRLIVVTNAGGPPPGDFRDWQRDDWVKAVDANMITPIELIKATVDGMVARGFGRM